MGPVCTQMLADYGADVIKIERKGAGDLSRSTFAPVAGHRQPDLLQPEPQQAQRRDRPARRRRRWTLVKALIADADVVINNFRAGVMDRMGLGYEDCRALNPRIVYAVGTGFGETGPYAHKGGQDVLAQAMSGVMARKRRRRRCRSAIYPTALADYTAGMHMVQGILLALLQRERTGEGQKISVSLYNSMLAMQMQEAAMIMMARLGGQLGRDAAVGRVRYAERRAGAGRRVQGQSAARHLRRAGDRRPVAGRALRRPGGAVRAQGRAAAPCSASASRATRASTGWRGWRSRTCCARRCATCARRWSTRRRCTTQMILEGDASAGRTLKFIASPIQMSGAHAGAAPRAAEAGRAHRRGAGGSAGAHDARRGRAHERDVLRGRGPRRDGHDRPARGAERGRPRRPRPSCSASGTTSSSATTCASSC